MKTRKKRYHILLALLCLELGAVGGTWAYYHSGSDVVNRLTTLESGVTLKEIFNPADQWVAGESKQKEVSFGNTGDASQVIRFKVTEAWYDNKGSPGDLTDDTPWTYKGTYSPAPAVVHYTGEVAGSSPSWVKADGYYYYTKVLGKGETTPPVIDKVAFSSAISNGGPGAADDFSGKRYSLTVQLESLDVNPKETMAGWKMTFTRNGDRLTWSKAP